MIIRKTQLSELDEIMKIYEHARAFMASTGNPNQWGPNKWPPREMIERNIKEGKHYVCEENGQIAACFYYDYGEDPEPSYDRLENGTWLSTEPYGVVHRIASSGLVKGAGRFCLEWAFAQCGHMRIDTHPDNKVMQNLVHKLGFVDTGIIYVPQDSAPRLAFEKITPKN